MARALTTAWAGPQSGQARSLVAFLHGYGADGADLLGLAEVLGPHLPDTVFAAPNAPERSVANPFGYQWFPIPWIDGSSEEEARSAMEGAVDDLNAWIDEVLDQTGLAPAQMALFGFSQGTMMSLHVAPRRPEALAGVVGFSGRLLEPERLAGDAASHPPVLLLHGDMDEVVQPQSMPEAAASLSAAGFEVTTHVMRGTGHGIAPDGLAAALAFLQARLGGAQS